MNKQPEMSTLEALEEAMIILKDRTIETDTDTDNGWRAKQALEVIEALIAQRGCEHFDSAVKDGRLTTLCDVIVFG
jgi:hypothetical protein